VELNFNKKKQPDSDVIQFFKRNFYCRGYFVYQTSWQKKRAVSLFETARLVDKRNNKFTS